MSFSSFVFLFVFYFCTVSILIYTSQIHSTVKTEFSETLTQSNLNNDIGDSSIAEQLIAESEEVSFIIENEDISFEPAIIYSE